MTPYISQRWYWFGFIVSCSLLAIAYFYFQKTLGLEACPLCIFQRVCLVAIAFTCLIGVLFHPQRFISKLLTFLNAIFAATGLGIAGRQVWLQHLPADKVPECGPDLHFMLNHFPFSEVIKTILSGSGECAKVQWHFLSFSMPEWMVLVFVLMLLTSIKLLFKRERRYF